MAALRRLDEHGIVVYTRASRAESQTRGSAGFHGTSARSVEAAPQVRKEHRDDVTVVISDLSLPDGRGAALVDRLRIERPEVKVVFVSGRSRSDSEVTSALQWPGTRFLEKPISFDELEDPLTRLVAEARCHPATSNGVPTSR